jgi:hypothetical protein
MEQDKKLNGGEQAKLIDGKSKGGKRPGIGKIIVWAVAAVVILVLGMQIVIADKYKVQVQVIAGEKKVGVNPTTEMLDFGDMSADTSATRSISLNASGADTRIHVSTFGAASDLIKINENDFTMKKGDEKKIELAMYMPPSAPVGKWYKGWVLVFKTPQLW